MAVKKFKKQAGFTIVEVAITLAVVAFVAILFMNFSRDITDTTLRFSRSLTTQQEIQQTLQLMMPEIRSAAQSNTGGYPIVQATTSTLVFYSDIDRDGLFERVRYFEEGNVFKKGVITPIGNPLSYSTSTEEVRELVNNLISGNQIFSYYDLNATSSESNALLSPIDILDIRMIKVNLVANQGTTSTISLVGSQDQATIRNLRYK